MSNKLIISLNLKTALVLIFFSVSQTFSIVTLAADGDYYFDKSFLHDDLTSMPNIVDMRYTSEVESYLRNYLVNGRQKSESVVRRMMLYFPIIEKKLEEHNLPQELKYLAIVESALSPHAKSRSGAVGLWQIMPPTARDLGVRMYHSVDERKDPYESTDAALSYLAKLYDRFGDWELTLAAYNAGPNRIGKIMDKTGKTDYWSLREDLPRETSNYIPAFIAATYVFSDFNKHGFIPERSHPDFHFTSQVKIFNHKVYLKDVAKLMKIDIDTLKFINPMYKRDYIPESPRGYNLILPNRCLKYYYQLRDTLERSDFVKLSQLTEMEWFHSNYSDTLQNIYLHLQYLVQHKENLFTVAKIFNIEIRQLKYWNNLPSLHVDHGMLIDLPLSLTEGRFLIRDYKPVPLTNEILWKSIQSIRSNPETCRYYQIATEQSTQTRSAFQHEQSMQDKHITILKGIPIKTQVAPQDFNKLPKIESKELIAGMRIQLRA